MASPAMLITDAMIETGSPMFPPFLFRTCDMNTCNDGLGVDVLLHLRVTS